MGIREQLAAHDARFISVSELLTSISNAEGITPQEVARAILLAGVLQSVSPLLRSHISGAYYMHGGEFAVSYELEYVAYRGNTELSCDAECDFLNGDPGLSREEVVAALKANGWSIPPCLADPKTTVQDHPVLTPPITITFLDAAILLSKENGGNWESRLHAAIKSDDIMSGVATPDPRQQRVSIPSLQEWCTKHGFKWPATVQTLTEPTIGEGLRQALAELRAECEALRDERAQLQEEMERLRTANAALRDARPALAMELLQIKGETFKKLLGVIEEFPQQYPNAKTAVFKLDDDVRPWIEKITSFGKREAHVFGTIVAEHFDLKTGRTKTFT